MSHLDLLKNGLRGELPEKNENGFVVSDDCRDYAIKQAAPFIKEHGPHLNKWDKRVFGLISHASMLPCLNAFNTSVTKDLVGKKPL